MKEQIIVKPFIDQLDKIIPVFWGTIIEKYRDIAVFSGDHGLIFLLFTSGSCDYQSKESGKQKGLEKTGHNQLFSGLDSKGAK